MREVLQTMARAAGGTARTAARLAGTGTRLAGEVAESCLARVGLVGREGVADRPLGADQPAGRRSRTAAGAQPDTFEPSPEDAAAEAVARQEARAAAQTAGEVQPETPPGDDDAPLTPSGIPAADEGFNPDTGVTDLVQPGTVAPGDEGALHAIESESAQLRAAAERHKN